MTSQLLIFILLNATTIITTSVTAQGPWATGGYYRPSYWGWGPNPKAAGTVSTPAPVNLTLHINVTGVNTTTLVDGILETDDVLRKAEEDGKESCNWYVQNQIRGIRNSIWYNINGVNVKDGHVLNYELFRLAAIAEHGKEVTENILGKAGKKCGDVIEKVSNQLKKLLGNIEDSHRSLLACPEQKN